MRQPSNSDWCIRIPIIAANQPADVIALARERVREQGENADVLLELSCFILEWFSNVAIRFLLSFFSYNIVIVFEQCLLRWMPVKLFFVKLNNEEMFLSFNDSHLLIWTNVLRDTVDSGLQVLDSSICHWNLDSGFQSLVGFRIPWAVFRIPKPRIPGSTSKICPDSCFNKGVILKPSQIPYYHNITL